MVILNSLPDVFALVFTHNPFITYSILFILMFFEGPVFNYIAAFAASLGYVNVWIIFTLSILGNQIPDMILYFIGGALKKKGVERVLAYIGLHQGRIAWLEKNIKKHPIKTVVSFKIIPNLPIPCLILSGFIKLPFKKFFWITLISNIVFAVFFTALGFYSGITAASIAKYLKIAEYLASIVIVSSVLLYFILKWSYSRLSKRLDRKK